MLAAQKPDSTPPGTERRRIGAFSPCLGASGADPMPRISAANLRSTAALSLISHSQMTRTGVPPVRWMV